MFWRKCKSHRASVTHRQFRRQIMEFWRNHEGNKYFIFVALLALSSELYSSVLAVDGAERQSSCLHCQILDNATLYRSEIQFKVPSYERGISV